MSPVYQMDVFDFKQLAADAGLLAEVLAAQGVHGQQNHASDRCPICQAIWLVRDTCERLGITIEIPPPFEH